MTFKSPVVLVLAALLATSPVRSQTEKPVPELPVSTFFQSAAISAVTFSPNGKFVACLVPYAHRTNLAVIDLEKGTKKLLTNFPDKQAVQPRWANDNRILFRVDDDGKESFSLYAVDRDGSDPIVLADGYAKEPAVNEIKARFGQVLARLENDPRSILVEAYITYADWPDVALMDLKTGKMRRTIEAPGNVDHYVLDRENRVRLAVVETDNRRRVLLRSDTGAWTTLAERQIDAPGWEPIGFEGDNRTLFIWSNIGRKTKAVYRYDVVEKRELDLVFGDETYDADDIIYDGSQHKVVGISYEADRTRFHWLDPKMKQLQEKLATALPDGVNYPRQFSMDGKSVLFHSSSDRDPGVYYLYNRERGKMGEIAVVKPDIDPDLMAPVKPVQFIARDGLELHGYLTLPRGRAAKNLPLIIHPHGGPYGIRDNWGFDAEVQFYANRGFAVLQVNYRGSGGYGFAFEAAGFKRWGLEMQNDLTDAVNGAVKEGIADPRRVVISGASYGGYATMAGLTMTPELYCAGINYVGLADIELFVPKTLPARRMYWWNTRIGELSNAADQKRLKETSPVNLVDRIRVPVLMAYGKNDPRVKIEQGYDLERAMKRAGKEFTMIMEADEGHGFRREERAINFYTKVDEFLKKHVPQETAPTNEVVAPKGSEPITATKRP